MHQITFTTSFSSSFQLFLHQSGYFAIECRSNNWLQWVIQALNNALLINAWAILAQFLLGLDTRNNDFQTHDVVEHGFHVVGGRITDRPRVRAALFITAGLLFQMRQEPFRPAFDGQGAVYMHRHVIPGWDRLTPCAGLGWVPGRRNIGVWPLENGKNGGFILQ